MNFATLQLLNQLKLIKEDAKNRNIFYRFIFNILYKFQSKKDIKIIDRYLKENIIDSEHMMDIIHTLNTFCNTNIITSLERRQIFHFSIREYDGYSIIEYEKQILSIDTSNKVNTCKIYVKLDSDTMQVTDIVNDNDGRTEQTLYSNHFSDNENHDFYNTVGRALLFGIKKYLNA